MDLMLLSVTLAPNRLRCELVSKVLIPSLGLAEDDLSLVAMESQLAKLLRRGKCFSCNCFDIYIISSWRLVSGEGKLIF